ncbi:SGNH/GDSL hydrolase family protein [Catenulispora pinistramenti]|uniref:SGNH/GDSL hydrolase family protein n=1 Tax=Catenulispora pinistramenti TaxID=2705254 RepID=UPI001E4DF96A|nr:SGNH/GDSL hydrolase family protein [Catenulispora pinistramenti]
MTGLTRLGIAKRVAAAAALSGGGIGVLTGGAIGLIVAEAKLARRAIGPTKGDPPRADGVYGAWYAAPGVDVIRIAILGDSSAAGYGVTESARTPGALLASGLAEAANAPVRLQNVAKVGGQSSDLGWQLERVIAAGPDGGGPDLAVIMIGANDVTHRVKVAESVRFLGDAVRRLRAAGTEVVVGTCPDLGSIRPVAQPLRRLARRWSRQLAAAQTVEVVSAGGRTVSLGSLLGPEFAARPEDMFGPDRFHPSAEGYAAASMALLPSIAAALGRWPDAETGEPDTLEPARGEARMPLARAAVLAAKHGGTEVGREVGSAARAGWGILRHRRRRQIAEPVVPPGADATAAAGGEPTDSGAGAAAESASA